MKQVILEKHRPIIAALFLLQAALLCLLTGCSSEKTESLSAEELDYFNSTEFFNNYEGRQNQFLSSVYDNPGQIDLCQLLYCGTGVVADKTEDEVLEAAVAQMGSVENAQDLIFFVPCDKMTTTNIDAFLTQYLGLTLEETDKIGLEQFVYLETYDAYYHFHGDTNYRLQVVFDQGEQQGDLIRLYYDDTFFHDGQKVVTLKQLADGNYHFVSNQKV